MHKYTLLLGLLLVMGCSTITNVHSNEQFTETTKLYKATIRWENMELAGKFLTDKDTEKTNDKKYLNDFKVTSYEVLTLKFYDDKKRVDQSVEIQYYNKKNMIEKKIIDNQAWVYESDMWLLTSGLPDFK